MKMRVVSLILVLVMVAVLLASCSTTNEASQPNPFANRFEFFAAGFYRYVIVDKATGVCYLESVNGGHGPALTVLLNADGTPVTWEEAQHEAD